MEGADADIFDGAAVMTLLVGAMRRALLRWSVAPLLLGGPHSALAQAALRSRPGFYGMMTIELRLVRHENPSS